MRFLLVERDIAGWDLNEMLWCFRYNHFKNCPFDDMLFKRFLTLYCKPCLIAHSASIY